MSTGAVAAKPNIVFILADDLGYGDLGCYGQKQIKTPNLDRLASEGMRFTQAYSGATVCAPSRSCLMTGLHGGHTRVRDNIPHFIFLQPDDLTVAEVLKQAGYRTGAIGKWSLGNPGSWGLPTMQGFDEWFGFLNQDHAHNYYPEFLWENDHEVLLQGNRANARKMYSADLFIERGLRFIEQNRQRPFFLYWAPTLPHWSDYPKNSALSQDVPSDEPYSTEPWPQVEKNYAAMVTRLDRHVGQILDMVRSTGIDRQTLIVFTSDNGPSAEALHRPDFFASAGPFRGVKRDLYEGGIRVPFLAQWKGSIRQGTVNDSVCAFWDFLPTAAELAGLAQPARTDGISLAPAFLGKPRQEHEYLYWDYGHTRDRFLQAVRMGHWKAVRTRTGAPLELYDLSKDPGEQSNLAAARPDIVAKMQSIMKAAYTESPDYPIHDRAAGGGG
jgi:arylsulfatase A-like enzyme